MVVTKLSDADAITSFDKPNVLEETGHTVCATISFVTHSCLKLTNIVSTFSPRLLWDSRLSSSLYHYSYSRRPGARHTTPGSRRVAEHLVRPLPLASACSAPRRKLQMRAPRVNSASTTTCPVARTADSSQRQVTEQRGGIRVRYKQLQSCYLSLLKLQLIKKCDPFKYFVNN